MLDPADVRPPVQRLPLRPGDRVLLYTDGVIEARDGGGAFYPLTDRLPHCATGCPVEVLRNVHQDVVRHVGHKLGDDAAMLLLQYEPVGPHLPVQGGRPMLAKGSGRV
ncbi:SpoIIE family protein phosphatase [Kitasatospora arboriphila]